MCEFVSSATRLVSQEVGEPIAESQVVGEPLKQVGKYLYKYQGTPNNVTTDNWVSLWISRLLMYGVEFGQYQGPRM